jgi:hypothetical protein
MKNLLIAIFVLLHGQYEKEYMVNVDMIRSYWDLDDGVGKDKGMVQYENGDTQFVRETADDITMLIATEVSRQRSKNLGENSTASFGHINCCEYLNYRSPDLYK